MPLDIFKDAMKEKAGPQQHAMEFWSMHEEQDENPTNEELVKLAELIASAQSNAEMARRMLVRIAAQRGFDLADFSTLCVICADVDFGFAGGYQLQGDRFVCQNCWEHLSNELKVFNRGDRQAAQDSTLIN